MERPSPAETTCRDPSSSPQSSPSLPRQESPGSCSTAVGKVHRRHRRGPTSLEVPPEWFALRRRTSPRQPQALRPRSPFCGEVHRRWSRPEKTSEVLDFRHDEVSNLQREKTKGFDLNGESISFAFVLPDPSDASVDQDDGRQPSLAAVHAPIMLRLDQMFLDLLPQEERIEKRQEADVWPFDLRPLQGRQILPQDPRHASVHVHGSQVLFVAFPNRSRARPSHVGPPREVRDRGGAVGLEIPPQEFVLRVGYGQVTPLPKPCVGAGEGAFVSPRRPPPYRSANAPRAADPPPRHPLGLDPHRN